jgi:hypothetical protein
MKQLRRLEFFLIFLSIFLFFYLTMDYFFSFS